MVPLFRKLFWIILFCVFTLGFVTLFDHPTVSVGQFITDAKGEVNDLIANWKPLPKKTDTSDKAQ